jgi:signal transduction histidine kinase
VLHHVPLDARIDRRFAGAPPDMRRRARLVAAFGLLGASGGVGLAISHVGWFDIPIALALAPLCAGLLSLASIPILLGTGSVTAGGHAVAAAWWVAVGWGVWLRGGITAPPVMCLVASPYITLAIIGRRAASVWLALALLGYLGLTLTTWPDLMPVAHRGSSNLLASSLFGGLLLLMAVSQEWLRQAAQDELTQAERRKVAAEHEAQLLRENRLASVGQLAAGMAHEINNPLCYLLANLDEIAAAELDAPTAEAARDALEGARRVRTIVRDLKTYSRIDDEELASVPLERVIAAALRMVVGEVRHRAVLRTELASHPRVRANETRLGQILINLIVNAAQAFPQGGRDNEIVIGLSEEGDDAVLSVRDNGCGMSPEVLVRVREPFFTTKPVGEGTGLGLSVCDNLVRRFGGQLHIASVAGEGTTVTVRLPRLPAVVTAPEPHPLERLARSTSS